MKIRLRKNEIISYQNHVRSSQYLPAIFSMPDSQWIEQNRLNILFHASGLTPSIVSALTKLYGSEFYTILFKDPFSFYFSETGCSLGMATSLWLRTSDAKNETDYARIAILESLRENEDNGNTYILKNSIILNAQTITGYSQKTIENAYEHCLERSEVLEFTLRRNTYAALTRHIKEERKIADLLLKRTGRTLNSISLSEIEARLKMNGCITPDKEQILAVKTAIDNQTSIITGGPGTGKTSIIKTIVDILAKLNPNDMPVCVSLAAKVARTIHNKTGLASETIHQYFGFMDGTFEYNAQNPINATTLILEEAFMVNNALMATILKATPETTRLIIVGDSEQLEPIGRGKPIHCILASEKIPTARLLTNHRSGAGSDIPESGKRVMRGQMPLTGRDVKWHATLDNTSTIKKIIENYNEMVGKYGERNVQILTGMHKETCGSQHINNVITKREGYAKGDRVIQLKNDRDNDFFNGETGTVHSVGRGKIIVRTDEGVEVEYNSSMPQNLAKAYCITYHKAQGLEYDCAINVFHPRQRHMLNRNIINVGLTRAKQVCTIIDQKHEMSRALSSINMSDRKSLLTTFIKKPLLTI